MDSNGIHPDVLRVARLALQVGGYTARQEIAYQSAAHDELTSTFVSHLNGVGGHSMRGIEASFARTAYVAWFTEVMLTPGRNGDVWTPAQRAVLLALIAEELL